MKIPHVDIVKHRRWWIGISLAIMLPGIVFLGICWAKYGAPLRPGIDFTGGSILQYQFEKPVELQQVREILEEIGLHGSQVQAAERAGKPVIVMRTKALSDDKQDQELRTKMKEVLKEKLGNFTALSEDKVSGVVGPELLQNGLWAMLLTFGAMVAYIKYRFMLDFAVCAILALFHDVLVLCGIFAILCVTQGIEVDSLFISAVLTVIGFSVHDTIVVFDRIRENMKYVGSRAVDASGKEYRKSFGDVANDSINQTLARSIYTSLTVVITLSALFFLGGSTTKDFVLAMLIGIISGTYSSIFFASVTLVWWRELQSKKKPAAVAAAAK